MLRNELCPQLNSQRFRPGGEAGFSAGVGGYVGCLDVGVRAGAQNQGVATGAGEHKEQEASDQQSEANVDVEEGVHFGGGGGFEGLGVGGEGVRVADVVSADC